MPRPVMVFVMPIAPVTYLIEYVFTFTLRHGNNSQRSVYNQWQQREARDRQTDGRTDRHCASIIS